MIVDMYENQLRVCSPRNESPARRVRCFGTSDSTCRPESLNRGAFSNQSGNAAGIAMAATMASPVGVTISVSPRAVNTRAPTARQSRPGRATNSRHRRGIPSRIMAAQTAMRSRRMPRGIGGRGLVTDGAPIGSSPTALPTAHRCFASYCAVPSPVAASCGQNARKIRITSVAYCSIVPSRVSAFVRSRLGVPIARGDWIPVKLFV
jgi:hypothetical protein